MKTMPLKVSILLFGFFLTMPVMAVEFDVQAEKVWWQYQEYAKDVPIASASLPSKSKGDGVKIAIILSTERDSDWFVGLSGSYMDSTSAAKERWGLVQTNDIKMKESNLRLDVSYEVMRHAKLGLWFAGRKQDQSRENFILNGAVTVQPGEPILERITSSWVGLSFVGTGGNQQQLQASFDVAAPLKVNVTNPGFPKGFTKKGGYRTAAKFRWSLPKSEVGVDGLNITLSYDYQELGGDLQTTGEFWPYNRWQTLGLGLLYAW